MVLNNDDINFVVFIVKKYLIVFIDFLVSFVLYFDWMYLVMWGYSRGLKIFCYGFYLIFLNVILFFVIFLELVYGCFDGFKIIWFVLIVFFVLNWVGCYWMVVVEYESC